MPNRITARLRFYRSISFWKYIRYNYFCRRILRKDKSRIIPYKGAVIELSETCKITLEGGDIEIGCDALRGSKTETRVRLREGAAWHSCGGCKLSYDTTLELLRSAVLYNGYFTMNSGSTLICANRITLGNDVMIARNAVIFDSDFHPLYDEEGNITNPPSAVTIGDHVWIGANTTILKGVAIGNGAVIGAGTKITKNIDENTLVAESAATKVLRADVSWERTWKDNKYGNPR